MELIILIGVAVSLIVICESGLGWCSAVHADGAVEGTSCSPERIAPRQVLTTVGPLFLLGLGLPLVLEHLQIGLGCLAAGVVLTILGFWKQRG
ncbi:hypothetical protein [Desulfonatronum thioautotrophicum]|uniref:hypothetical protein n=1 Tax=Desulfonatronum thioautotrophicum TaxID=617001 RepID=UPI0005EBCD50|nr:hypothetical protein [Desulfonatronum thioautotrophicum]